MLTIEHVLCIKILFQKRRGTQLGYGAVAVFLSEFTLASQREQQQQDVHYESIDGVGISASSMDGRLEGDAELGLGHGFCTLRPCKKILRVSDLAVTLPALIGASHDRGNLPDFSPVLPSIRHESKQPWPPLPFLSHIRRRSLPLVLVPPPLSLLLL